MNKAQQSIRTNSIVVIEVKGTGFNKGVICKLVKQVKKGRKFFGQFDAICISPKCKKGNDSIHSYIGRNDVEGYFQHMSQLRKATPEEKLKYQASKKASKKLKS